MSEAIVHFTSLLPSMRLGYAAHSFIEFGGSHHGFCSLMTELPEQDQVAALKKFEEYLLMALAMIRAEIP